MTIDGCKWPNLRTHYLDALQDAVRYVLVTYPSVVGIVASGTIVRGNPDLSSDLDVYVIHLDTYRQRVQRFSKGVLTEIFVNPPLAVERYFQQQASAGRPITAHLLATGVVIAQTHPAVEALRSRARELLKGKPAVPADLTVPRYMIATLFEDAMDVVQRDRATARMILSQAVEQMLRHAFTKNGMFQPRPKDLLGDTSELDPSVRRLATQFFTTNSFRRQIRLAGLLADRILGTRGFFEWQSAPESVQ